MRLTSLVYETLKYGLLYSLANHRIHSRQPLEPIENWKYWCDPKSSWLVSIARSYPPRAMRKAFWESMLNQSHATGIQEHYDVSNEFYSLFLDHWYKFYSCADFYTSLDSLEVAQSNKAEFIRELMSLDGDEKILDLGCGWGGMMRFLKDKGHKGKIDGFTLSREQLSYCQNEMGLDVSLVDFISEPWNGSPYGRIYSIGALEHVRPEELDEFYRKMYKSLTHGGLAVHQFFSFPEESYPISTAILQLFFPGTLLVTHQRHVEAANNAGFSIIHDSIHDYKPTLRAWYLRLCSNREKALEIVGLEVFNRYMTFFPVAWLFFNEHQADLHRLALQKNS